MLLLQTVSLRSLCIGLENGCEDVIIMPLEVCVCVRTHMMGSIPHTQGLSALVQASVPSLHNVFLTLLSL